jgi:hypothetical protein
LLATEKRKKSLVEAILGCDPALWWPIGGSPAAKKGPNSNPIPKPILALELLTLQGGLTGVIGGLVGLLGSLGLNLLGSIGALANVWCDSGL